MSKRRLIGTTILALPFLGFAYFAISEGGVFKFLEALGFGIALTALVGFGAYLIIQEPPHDPR